MCGLAQVAELVDAIDSKSIDGNIMRVRFSPWAPEEANLFASVTGNKKNAPFKWSVFLLSNNIMIFDFCVLESREHP